MLGILVLISINTNAGEAKYNNKISDEIKGISSQNIYDSNNNYANYDNYDDEEEEEDNDNDYYDKDDNDDDEDYYYYYEYDEED
jgi:hypothetical protein